jgi:hypothetical protein
MAAFCRDLVHHVVATSTMKLGTRSDGVPYRVCVRHECAAPTHIENCFRCAGFGEMVHATEGKTVLVTAADATRGDLPQLATLFIRCTACGSDFRGIAGLDQGKPD